MGALTMIAAVWLGVLGAVAAWAGIRTRPRGGSHGNPTNDIARAIARTTVILLRPCAGTEPGLVEALSSSREAHPGTQVRFLVAQPSDDARPLAERVAGTLLREGHDARTVVTAASAPNMKVAQLARALDVEPGRANVVLVADSDVVLSVAVLSSLLVPLVEGRADATWAPTVEIRAVTRADRASAAVLSASLHAFPLLAGLDRAGMVGKVFAVRREALDAVGGFASLTEHLGEDVELSRRLRRQGGCVVACSEVAASIASGRSWGDLVRRYARWIAVVRAQRTALLVSYPLLLAATPLVLSLDLVAWALEGPRAAVVLGPTLLVRWSIGALARRRSGLALHPAALLVEGLVADALLLTSLARALVRRDVVWRGSRLALASHGLVVGRSP